MTEAADDGRPEGATHVDYDGNWYRPDAQGILHRVGDSFAVGDRVQVPSDRNEPGRCLGTIREVDEHGAAWVEFDAKQFHWSGLWLAPSDLRRVTAPDAGLREAIEVLLIELNGPAARAVVTYPYVERRLREILEATK